MEQLHLYMLALSNIPQVGPITGRNLISYCGSPEMVFKTKPERLIRIPQVGQNVVDYLRNPVAICQAEAELQLIENKGIKLITYLDEMYPSRLKHFEESPLILYQKGDTNLNPKRTIGIIGTRAPTPLGRLITEELAAALQPYQITVVSGMAHGIDSVAHQAAIKLGIPTMGILGHGFHTMYPAANRELARLMAAAPNSLITEYSWHTLPDKENFPMRNRIIAGLSDALIVVESKEKGGSMITAEIANRYNKDVFAVPGRFNDATSKGCNLLIKHHKAHLLENAEDLIRIMRWDDEDSKSGKAIQPQLFHDLSLEEQSLVNYLKTEPDAQIDDLGFNLKMAPSAVSAMLISLEFKGLIRQLPGKKYTLVQGIN
jgi:DNA processing protein